MKVGFLVNIMLLLCFICSQLLIWLIDGTLVKSLAELLNMQSSVFTQSSRWQQQQRGQISEELCDGDDCLDTRSWSHLVRPNRP